MALINGSDPPPPRKLAHWIREFVARTDELASSKPYRLWSAYAAVATAVQRKVWIVYNRRRLYPNMFTLLVGPPGGGKTTAIRAVRTIMTSIPTIRMAPNMVTKEAFIMMLTKSTEGFHLHNELYTQSPYSVMSDEYLNFHRPGDVDFTRNLTDLYDCANVWEYMTRGRMERDNKYDIVQMPFVNILGGVTERSFGEVFGPQIGTGFTARLTLAYANDIVKVPDLFDERGELLFDTGDLVADMEAIYKLKGPMSATLEVRKEFQRWYDQGMLPLPTHHNLEEYLVRRPIHWMKLCMLSSLARTNKMVIEMEDLEMAREVLLAAEKLMPKAFAYAGRNPFAEHVGSVQKWVWMKFQIDKRPIHEGQIREQLLVNVPVQLHAHIVDYLVTSGLCTEAPGSAVPNRLLIPMRPA